MNERSQGAVEYLLMLGAVLVIVGIIVLFTYAVSIALGLNVGGQIDSTMENVIVPGLVGVLFGLNIKFLFSPEK